jgi:hypothetical protein
MKMPAIGRRLRRAASGVTSRCARMAAASPAAAASAISITTTIPGANRDRFRHANLRETPWERRDGASAANRERRMIGFSLDWLRLRAPIDGAARDAGLAQRFAAALRRPADRAVRLVDLGSGTGANARALAPLIGGDQEWLLVDDDAALLEFCAAEHIAWAAREGWSVEKSGDAVLVQGSSGRWRFSARRADLAHELGAALAESPDGIAFAGLADLVSAGWIDALAVEIERRRVPLLSALAADGRRRWQPPDAADDELRDAFGRHQRRDKGFGPALGGAGTVYLGARMAAAGCAVATAASDWVLDAGQNSLLATLIEAERQAASAERPEAAARFAAWAGRRRAQLAAGSLSFILGQRDLLAVPRGL